MKNLLFDENDFLLKLFDAIPFPSFVVDEDVRMLFWNTSANNLIGTENPFRKRTGEVLNCIHSTETINGCGNSPSCESCIVRNSVSRSFHEKIVCRQKTIMGLQTGTQTTEVPFLVTTSHYEYKQTSLVILILQDIHELIQIGSLVPMCAKCKKIRTQKNEWEKVEKYLKSHFSDIDITHGLCPDCLRESLLDEGLM